jgi:NAD+ diphosphatase
MNIGTDLSSRWFVFLEDLLLVLNQPDGSYIIPKTWELDEHTHFIGNINNTDCYCTEISPHFNIPNNMSLIPLRQALITLNSDFFNPVIKAFQIIRWNKNHQYCGQCGNKTIDKTTSMTFERHCPHCSMIYYPRISPSIIVRIQKGKQILMARGPHFKPGIYGLIAGFIEPGESAEDAVQREVMEEVGIEIKNVRYFGSQPWPFPDALMLAFTAEHAAGELSLDHIEIEDAGWYDANNLPGLPSSGLSIGRKLIDDFITYS